MNLKKTTGLSRFRDTEVLLFNGLQAALYLEQHLPIEAKPLIHVASSALVPLISLAHDLRQREES